MRKITISVILIICIFTASFSFTKRASASPPPDVSVPISDALDYLESAQGTDGNIAGFSTSSWAVMAIVAAGEDPDSGRWIGSGGQSVVDYLITNKGMIDDYLGGGGDHPYFNYLQAINRFILAMTAVGENPTNINGTNYVALLKNNFNTTTNEFGNVTGYLADDFWGVMALISAGESPSSSCVQGGINFIKSNQNGDGGWGWALGADSDPDDTAAAIMALSCAGESNTSPWITNALQYLKVNQQSDGGYKCYHMATESNSASDSWVIDALVSVGRHPAQWPKVGSNVIEHLLSLQVEDGSFDWLAGTQSNPEFVTSYAIVAMCYNSYPVNLPPFTAELGGDINGDYIINYQDLNAFVIAYIKYGNGDPSWDPDADMNWDNIVNYQDLNLFVTFYIGYGS